MSKPEFEPSVLADARKEKGGSPEDARQGKMNMLNVAHKPAPAQAVPQVYNITSANKKLGIWLDSLVAAASSKGKPTAHMVTLTPDLAALLLERNPANRKINENLVDRYSYEIFGRRWVFNGEPIIVADTGELNDGQHRCRAVVAAQLPIEVLMLVGIKRETRTTLDQGRARSAGDYLSMEGHTNTLNLAAAANYAWQFQTFGKLNPKGARATKSEILNFVEENPGLHRSLRLFDAKKTRYIGGYAVFAFCHYAISQVSDRGEVDNFFYSMIKGANLAAGNPALYARNRLTLMTGGRDQNGKAEIIFKAWNAHRRGEAINRIIVTGDLLPVLEA